MKNYLMLALLLALAAPLAGCGISGGLKTPPPIWGEANADMPVEADGDAAVDPAQTVTSDNSLDDDDDDDNDIGYGVDVADTP
jgi:predicted small lipoprotein YifL